MCAAALSFVGDVNMAEVAVQETFLVALRYPEKIFRSENPVGWLYKALFNVSKHIIRDRKKLQARTVSFGDSLEDALSQNDDYSFVDNKIAESEEMKLIVNVYLNGYSMQEMADRLGISLGACKMRIKRAKERLKEKLKDYRY